MRNLAASCLAPRTVPRLGPFRRGAGRAASWAVRPGHPGRPGQTTTEDIAARGRRASADQRRRRAVRAMRPGVAGSPATKRPPLLDQVHAGRELRPGAGRCVVLARERSPQRLALRRSAAPWRFSRQATTSAEIRPPGPHVDGTPTPGPHARRFKCMRHQTTRQSLTGCHVSAARTSRPSIRCCTYSVNRVVP